VSRPPVPPDDRLEFTWEFAAGYGDIIDLDPGVPPVAVQANVEQNPNIPPRGEVEGIAIIIRVARIPWTRAH
jgi:hypothetical protein